MHGFCCEAAPNAVAENLYGPTEVTLACTLYRWEEGSQAAVRERECADRLCL